MNFSKIALVAAFAAGVLGDEVLPALPKLANIPDAAPPAVSDTPVFRGRGAAPAAATVAAVETDRAGLRASSPETRGTLQPKGMAHGTAYHAHPALKLKGVEEDVDLSSPSLFEDRVNIATNHSGGVAVQEETEIFFLLPIVTALVIDEAVNDGGVRHAVGDVLAPVVVPLYGFFMEVLNPAIAAIFETIGQAIYDALNLDIIDQAAMHIINGGIANSYDIITDLLGDVFDTVRNAFIPVVQWITTIRDGLDAIGALDFTEQIAGPADRSKTSAVINDEPQEERIKITDGKGNTGYLSSDELNLIQSSDGLYDLMDVLKGNRMISMVTRLQNLINGLKESFDENTPSNAMDAIKDELANIFRNAQSALQGFLDKTDGLGSLQFLVTAEIAGVAGVGLEAGISIDVRQILHFLAHNFQWDLSVTQLLSFHVGYALDIGVQGGGDVGFCVGYHTSRVTGVNGFGWGFSLEGAFGYAAGVSVAWPLPGSHIPNQFVAQIIGAGASVEAAAFWNHAIIVGYLDTQLGFMLAAPSVNAARFSGNPSLYYSKYSWNQLGHTLFLYPSPQGRWRQLGWNEDSWDMNSCGNHACQPPATDDTDWSQLSSNLRSEAAALGYDEATWNAPTASHGFYRLDPLGYFAPYHWRDMLDFEMNLFTCLGWNEAMWESTDQSPQVWDASWDNIGPERRVCAAAMGYDEVHWNGKHHHNNYELATLGAVGCRQVGESVTSHEECVGATEMIGYRFRENGARGWDGCPTGCFCIAASNWRRCYWNTNPTGRGRHDIQPLCTATTSLYELTPSGAASCSRSSRGLYSNPGCREATREIGYSFQSVVSYSGWPSGCFCTTTNSNSRYNRHCWLNTHAGQANRRGEVLCTASSFSYELTPSGAASCPHTSAAVSTETECEEATFHMDYSFTAMVSYSGWPSGCFCTTTNSNPRYNRHCWFNTHAGQANRRGEVLCRRSYELTPSGAASCPQQTSIVPTETECREATRQISYSFASVVSYSGWPSGCFCTTTNSNPRYNRHCWLNTHAGQANSRGEVLCRR